MIRDRIETDILLETYDLVISVLIEDSIDGTTLIIVLQNESFWQTISCIMPEHVQKVE